MRNCLIKYAIFIFNGLSNIISIIVCLSSFIDIGRSPLETICNKRINNNTTVNYRKFIIHFFNHLELLFNKCVNSNEDSEVSSAKIKSGTPSMSAVAASPRSSRRMGSKLGFGAFLELDLTFTPYTGVEINRHGLTSYTVLRNTNHLRGGSSKPMSSVRLWL